MGRLQISSRYFSNSLYIRSRFFAKPTVEKLLLVADLQLIGEKDEVLILVIDLKEKAADVLASKIDDMISYDGLSATDDEFERYFDHFYSIFQYESREQKYFAISGVIALYRQNDVEYLKLDIDMLESYVDDKRTAIMKQTQNHSILSSSFRIVLNYWPLLNHL
ncbi:unnamed protein product [Rotaria sordida]|uniref:Uncharacterized protein n=1 Tax=Rotaria sordida TaxID=392033 RepID=A0A814YKB2_9BILA|nr:unnamed protein product [Rotaria sordida]